MTAQEPALLIVGTGAMACLFAARLSAAGNQVTMLGTWPEGLQAIRQGGVRVVEPDGHEKAYPVRAVDYPDACPEAHYALVLVKAWQTERAAAQLAGCLAPDGLALTLQNGLGNRETLAQALGTRRAAQGATTSGATLLGPGRVRPAGDGKIILGDHPGLEPLVALLRIAGFEVESVPDPSSVLWGKLVINAAINPLTAILGVPNGALVERPSARLLMAAAAREAASVAAGRKIRLPYEDPAAEAETVARRTAGNISSMLQDVRRAAPTEIEAICGAIIQEGERAHFPTPINQALRLLVKAIREEKGIGNKG